MTEEDCTEVFDDENICRALFSPGQITKKNKIKASAFRARPCSIDVSVNRRTLINEDNCKTHSKSINMKEYVGFAVLSVKSVKLAGVNYNLQSLVKDSRDGNYFGHADIIHPFTLERGETLSGEKQLILQDMADRSDFFQDEDPEACTWCGEKIPEIANEI